MYQSSIPIPIRQLAAILSIPRSHVTRAVKQRKLPCVFPTPNNWNHAYTLAPWVDAWIKSNAV